jgi:hypothetical protein
MAKVTRRDREAAAKALGWWGPALLGEHSQYWLEHGGAIVKLGGKTLNMSEEEAVATAIAKAREEGAKP